MLSENDCWEKVRVKGKPKNNVCGFCGKIGKLHYKNYCGSCFLDAYNPTFYEKIQYEIEIERGIHYRLRRKKFSFELLFENEFDEDVDNHHISDAFVIPIPRRIHKKNLGKNHRELLKPIVEKLYNISYVIIENN